MVTGIGLLPSILAMETFLTDILSDFGKLEADNGFFPTVITVYGGVDNVDRNLRRRSHFSMLAAMEANCKL